MPSRKRAKRAEDRAESGGIPVRPLWSGTITFGLVSIPVELLTAVRPRQTAMKLVDNEGHALGRRYYCSKEGKKLDNDEIVRGYETDAGEMVVITDEEFESAAPEMSGDIDLHNFVPLEQIPPLYFQRPYFLAPSGKSAKAYHLLAATLERTGRVGIGSFVMRGHEYLVAIVADNGVLRADTLRYADEVRTPEIIGLPQHANVPASKVAQFAKVIDELTQATLDLSEFDDKEAETLKEIVATKEKHHEGIIHQPNLEDEDAESTGGDKVIDLMEVLRKSLSKHALVNNAASSAPISLAERRRDKTPTKHRKRANKKS